MWRWVTAGAERLARCSACGTDMGKGCGQKDRDVKAVEGGYLPKRRDIRPPASCPARWEVERIMSAVPEEAWL